MHYEMITWLLQALGMTVDMTSRTMGTRTRRFAMYVDNGEVSICLTDCFSDHFFCLSTHDMAGTLFVLAAPKLLSQ